MSHTGYPIHDTLHISTIVLWLCAGCIIGIGVSSIIENPAHYSSLVLLLFCSACFCVTFFRVRTLVYTSVIVIGMSAGFARVLLLPSFTANPYNEYVTIQGRVYREPDISVDQQRLLIESPELQGRMELRMPLQPRYAVGDILNISCILRKPEPFDSFRYDKFLERHHVSVLCYRPKVEFVSSQESFMRQLFATKQWMLTRLQRVLAPPENTILLGVLFGLNHAMPDDLAEAFRITGTTHLLVISGSNIALFIALLLSVLKYLPISRKTAVWCVVIFIALYAVFTGLQPPAIRAAVCGSMALIAMLFGRPGHALRLLLIAATCMLLVNPLQLMYDAGFQLSFLATAGIILFNPWFENLLHRVPEILGLRSSTATTLSAIVVTAPLIAYSFDTISIIALPANIIIGPLMTIITLAGLVGVFTSVILPDLWGILINMPLYYLSHLTLGLVQWCAQIPYAAVAITHMPLWFFWALYLMLAYAAYTFYRKNNTQVYEKAL